MNLHIDSNPCPFTAEELRQINDSVIRDNADRRLRDKVFAWMVKTVEQEWAAAQRDDDTDSTP